MKICLIVMTHLLCISQLFSADHQYELIPLPLATVNAEVEIVKAPFHIDPPTLQNKYDAITTAYMVPKISQPKGIKNTNLASLIGVRIYSRKLQDLSYDVMIDYSDVSADNRQKEILIAITKCIYEVSRGTKINLTITGVDKSSTLFKILSDTIKEIKQSEQVEAPDR